MQESFSAIEECGKPVLSLIHGACIGAGVDLISACDMRWATKDAFFAIKEIDLGMTADVGTLQRTPRIIGNMSLFNEACFSGARFSALQAKEMGLVSRIFDAEAEMMEGALKFASEISEKSPLAIMGIKESLLFSRDHSVQEGLDRVALWNSVMLQSEDVQAAMTKSKPTFSKL